jgi:1,4-dihydroxy-2-naphthoate octaprenyltransferase
MATNTSTAEGTAGAAPLTLGERLAGWREIMQTANPPASGRMDTAGKWLVMTRAAVFPMTLWSGTIGALLAVEYGTRVGGVAIDWIGVVLAVVGLVLAHAANN